MEPYAIGNNKSCAHCRDTIRFSSNQWQQQQLLLLLLLLPAAAEAETPTRPLAAAFSSFCSSSFFCVSQ
jgi:hypothetical protein